MIEAPNYMLPTYGHSEDFARPHIEIDRRGYHYVVVERGQEWERFTTSDLDELLYRVFKSVTSNISTDYELKHRVAEQDSRRIAFQHRVELLSRLSPKWAEQCSQELEEILKKHPFDDLAGIRATLTGQLRAQGLSQEEAWRMACERYPSLKE